MYAVQIIRIKNNGAYLPDMLRLDCRKTSIVDKNGVAGA